MGWLDRLVQTAKDSLAQQGEADSVRYPAGSAMWSAQELRTFHDSLLPGEQATAQALGQVMTLRLYDRMPVSQRQETMDQVSQAVSRVFAYAPAAPVIVDERQTRVSYYKQGLIVLDQVALRDVRTATHTALHESFHCYQKKCIDQWRRGELPPGDPRLAMVPVWAYNFAHYIVPKNRQSFENYIRQPVEFHAERFAHRVLALTDWLPETPTPPVPAPGARTKPGNGPEDLYDMMYD
jgi:hypothetical protein